MSQYSSEIPHVLPDDRGLAHLIDLGLDRGPDQPVFSHRAADGWTDISYRRLDAEVRAVAGRFVRAGVGYGDRVAVLGRTSYEWALVYLAVAAVGAVAVPVYPTASDEQVRHVVGDSGASWAVAETPEDCARLTAAGSSWRTGTWSFDVVSGWAGEAAGPDPATDDRRRKVRADDLAVIVYTSGTTGLPKGCMLTHRNMFASSANTVLRTGDLFRGSTLLALPLSHVFGQTILLACLFAGTRTAPVPGIPDLVGALEGFRPTFLALVPYALEKLRKRTRVPAAGGAGPIDPAAEQAAVDAGLAGHTAEGAGYQAVRDSWGGRLTHVISGGASLDPTTAAYFRGLGVDILNCYGLTEAATAVTVNGPDTNRPGTVGRAIPGVTVGIADDGEVLVRGPNVSPGYWSGSYQASAAACGAGPWLHTGDLGTLDDGFLTITGRRKEILVTNGGKNVAPAPLEDRVRLHPLVSNCLVVGEGRSYVAALLTLDPAAVAAWLAGRGLRADGPSWWTQQALTEELQTAVDVANRTVSRAESIRRFAVLPDDFTVAAGELTPSMKLRRAVIERERATAVSALYA